MWQILGDPTKEYVKLAEVSPTGDIRIQGSAGGEACWLAPDELDALVRIVNAERARQQHEADEDDRWRCAQAAEVQARISAMNEAEME